jgi:hypothetical protein
MVEVILLLIQCERLQKFSNLRVNNKTISDSKIIAESFNEYFVNIGPRLASEASEEFYDEGLTNNNNQPASMSNSTFYFSQINVENVALTLHNLKANKYTGLDKYQLKFLNYHQILLPHL